MAGTTITTKKSRGKGKKKKKSSSSSSDGGGKLKIKPFVNPPSLPTDFYEKTSGTLLRAMECILRHEPLYVEDVPFGTAGSGMGGAILKNGQEQRPVVAGGSSGGGGGGESPKSTTSYPEGIDNNKKQRNNIARRSISREELYRSVEDLCVHKFGPRLYNDVMVRLKEAAKESVSALAANDNTDGSSDDATMMREGGTSSGGAYEVNGAVKDSHGEVYFVNLTNAILAADNSNPSASNNDSSENERPEKVLQNVWKVYTLFTEYLSCVRSIFLYLDRAFVYLEHKNKVVPRSTHAAAVSAMGLWDVGIAALRRCMTFSPGENTIVSTAPPAGVGGEVQHKTSVLGGVIYAGTQCLVAELNNESTDRPLIRNCVRMLHELDAMSDFAPPLVSPSPLSSSSSSSTTTTTSTTTITVTSSTKLHGGFYTELMARLVSYFDQEGRKWMLDGSDSGTTTTSSSSSAPSFLLHVEQRLKQVMSMAVYYLPNSTPPPILHHSPMTPSTAATSHQPHHYSNNKRLLASIVDMHLLKPHLTESCLLHPRHLHPLLDDPTRITPDVKRLYSLSRRIVNGTEILRTAFAEYGKQKGLGILHPQSSSSSGAGAAAGPKELEKTIIPQLLQFKAHLEALHNIAFGYDDSFATAIRSVLEDVLNSGGTEDSISVSSSSKQPIGDGGRRVAELLAKHVDQQFKNPRAQISSTVAPHTSHAIASSSSTTAASSFSLNMSTVDQDPSETFQTSILSLFRHIHSKDVFEAFYKRDFAKRLLLKKCTSADMERSFLSKLKAECGGGYTSKMEGMFKDMDLSRDVMAHYASYLAGQQQNAASSSSISLTTADPSSTATSSRPPPPPCSSVDMDVQVLTTGYWPVYPQHPSLILPAPLASHKANFESYYKTKYQGRRITWQFSLAQCIVKAHFPKIGGQSRDLIISLCQTLVLLCFNTDSDDITGGYTILDVMKKTGIEDRGEAERVLQSLSLGREGTRVLTKIDRDENDVTNNDTTTTSKPKKKKPKKTRRSVSDHDIFVFNASFTSNQRRIKITNVQMKETTEERTKTHEAVSRDRLYLIDAAVVRIMKARKTIDHRSLMAEVMNQLKFPATAVDVKKRVESLIEREYMERCDGDRSRYNYLA